MYSSAKGSSKARELYVTNVTEHDSGEYTCKARYGNQEITKKFNLLVYSEYTVVGSPSWTAACVNLFMNVMHFRARKTTE